MYGKMLVFSAAHVYEQTGIFLCMGKCKFFHITHIFEQTGTRLGLFCEWENVCFSTSHMFVNRLEPFCEWENVSFSAAHMFMTRLELFYVGKY